MFRKFRERTAQETAEEEYRPKIHVTSLGVQYVDAEEVFRSQRVQSLLGDMVELFDKYHRKPNGARKSQP